MAEEFPMPENTQLFQHQIAGHCHGTGKTKLGILKHANGCILKPGKREMEFYKKIYDPVCTDGDVLFLRSFTPTFCGAWETEFSGKKAQYSMLEDITQPFIKPSILDVKIGAKTYDPEASAEKIKQETGKYPAAVIIGFRILGMRIYQHAKDAYLVVGQEFGRQQTPESLVTALHTFLDNQKGIPAQEIVNDLLRRLMTLEEWYSRQRKFAFYSSSLLLVYEGAKLLPNTHVNGTKTTSKISDVRMIDFAHVFPTSECDTNYLFGLNKLIETFKSLLGRV